MQQSQFSIEKFLTLNDSCDNFVMKAGTEACFGCLVCFQHKRDESTSVHCYELARFDEREAGIDECFNKDWQRN